LTGVAIFGKSYIDGYSDDGEISAIYLSRDYIGKGYGHTLFTKAENMLRDKGYKHFILDVFSENVSAIAFYQKHGFEKIDERSIRLGGEDYPIIVMRKNNGDKLNIFDLPPLPLIKELTTTLAKTDNVRIKRIISTGQTSDWYDQDETEFVVLLQGGSALEFENGRIVTMEKGDTIVINPHERHKVKYTSTEPPCVWLCVFY
jgi:cupin 2 domain-containing protein